EGDAGGTGRAGAGRDHDLGGGDATLLAGGALDTHRMRVDEAAVPGEHLHLVAAELAADDVDLTLDDVLDAREHVLARDVVLHPVALAVDAALAHAGQEDNGLAQRLGRDRARVRADPAERLAAVDHGDAAAELGGLDRGALAARARADDEEVVVELHAVVIGGGRRGLTRRPSPLALSSCAPWPSTASRAGR